NLVIALLLVRFGREGLCGRHDWLVSSNKPPLAELGEMEVRRSRDRAKEGHVVEPENVDVLERSCVQCRAVRCRQAPTAGPAQSAQEVTTGPELGGEPAYRRGVGFVLARSQRHGVCGVYNMDITPAAHFHPLWPIPRPLDDFWPVLC